MNKFKLGDSVRVKLDSGEMLVGTVVDTGHGDYEPDFGVYEICLPDGSVEILETFQLKVA